MFELFFKLIVAHVFVDFSLQSDLMGKAKNKNNESYPRLVGEGYVPYWPYWLTAHAVIHGGAVYLATGSLLFGCIEIIAHWIIDFAKCEKWTNTNQDQLLHVLCKIIYIGFLI